MNFEDTRTDSVIRVALVDPHPVVATGVRAALSQMDGRSIAVSAVARSADEYLESGVSPSIDIVVLEPAQVEDPWDVVDLLAGQHRAVVIFTADERPVPIKKALVAGATAVVLKSDPLDHLAWAIKHASEGCSDDAYLSPTVSALMTSPRGVVTLSERQAASLEAIANGLSYRLAARESGISQATVREHLRRTAQAYARQGIETWNSHGLVAQARRDGNLR